MDRQTDGRTDGRMDRRTDRPKPICSLNFFKVGGIKKNLGRGGGGGGWLGGERGAGLVHFLHRIQI